MTPAQILRLELPEVPAEVLAQLPEREQLKKSIRRVRKKTFPANPKSLEDLDDLPDRYKRTFVGENFLINDTNDVNGRVLVFSTRRNMEFLARSSIWFLDGTFKVSYF